MSFFYNVTVYLVVSFSRIITRFMFTLVFFYWLSIVLRLLMHHLFLEEMNKISFSSHSMNDKVLNMRTISTDILRRHSISPLLSLIHTTSLYDSIRENYSRAKALGFIDSVTIYVVNKAPKSNKNRLESILQSCHDWATSRYTAFGYGVSL